MAAAGSSSRRVRRSRTLRPSYTLSSAYLQSDALEAAGLTHFDAWHQAFGKIGDELETDAGGRIRPTTRLRGFVNFAGLRNLYDQVADIMTWQDIKELTGIELERPKLKGGDRSDIAIPEGTALKNYMANIRYRIEHLDPQDRETDNMLLINNDARKAAIDLRLVDPKAIDRRG